MVQTILYCVTSTTITRTGGLNLRSKFKSSGEFLLTKSIKIPVVPPDANSAKAEFASLFDIAKKMIISPHIVLSYYLHIKMSLSTKQFFDDSKEFLIQAVCGTFVACKKMKINISEDIFESLLANYLNNCYHSYFSHDDEYVTTTYSAILTKTCVKNIICFTHWCMNIGIIIYPKVIEHFKSTIYTPHNISGYRAAMKISATTAYDDFAKDFLEKGNVIKCCGKIETTDDGGDIFIQI